MQPTHLDQIPDVPLDKVLSYLDAEDLRRFYQVSKTWRRIVQARPLVDSRRVELVKRIRQNKENIPEKNVPLDSLTPVNKRTESPPVTCTTDGKPGGRKLLGPITNSKKSAVQNGNLSVLQTPTSRFLQELEAGKKLLKGQQLFRCPECRSPVPSPVPSATKSLRSTRTASKILDNASYNQDSGYQSLTSICTDTQDVSGSAYEENNNLYPEDEVSQEEFSLSIIATPDPVTVGKRFTATPDLYATPKPVAEFSGKRVGNTRTNTASNFSSSSSEKVICLPDSSGTDVAQCPSCAYKFCCHCQSTAHPGKKCFVIDGDLLTTPCPSVSGDKKLTKAKIKSDKKAALRRLKI